jgi:hypothetical protein
VPDVKPGTNEEQVRPIGGSNVPTGKPVGEPTSDLTRFERVVARWTIVQGVIALLACSVAAVAMVATWLQTIRMGELVELNNNLLHSRLYSTSVSHSTEIYKILIEKPKLRKYIYDGQDIDAKHPDYNEFASLADTIIDVFDMTLMSMEIKDARGRAAWPGRIGWRNWMVDVVSTSPGLRRYFAASKEFYAENATLLALFEEGERKAAQKARKKKSEGD